MKRTQSTTRIGDNQVRYKIRLEDDESSFGSEQANFRQYHFLQELAQNYFALLQCGPAMYQKLTIYHGGGCWIAEAEALVDESRHG